MHDIRPQRPDIGDTDATAPRRPSRKPKATVTSPKIAALEQRLAAAEADHRKDVADRRRLKREVERKLLEAESKAAWPAVKLAMATDGLLAAQIKGILMRHVKRRRDRADVARVLAG